MDYGMDEFELLDDQPTPFARWLLPALVTSIALHIAVLLWLGHVRFFTEFLNPPAAPPPVTFKLARLPIDPKLLDPKVAEKKHEAAVPQAVKLPDDKPAFDQMMAQTKGAPAAPRIDNPMLAEKPKVEATSYQQTVQAAQQGGVKSVTKDFDQVRNDLLMEKPGVSGQPLLDIAKTGPDSGGSPAKLGDLAGSDTPGFSNLDDLLAETGPLTQETAPIRMDSDVLYAYDRYDLEPQSVESLQKLGTLIQRNPQLNFSIEGHSDSSGDPAYNQHLSEMRAEAVKSWLVQYMHIDPSRISTRGFGSTRLIVPATQPFDEQKEALNRRVEIVLHDRNAAP